MIGSVILPYLLRGGRPAAAPVRYLSLCSGIEAATAAWHSLGWEPVAFCEIDPFPAAVLAHHWPHVPNLRDMTTWREWSDDMLAQVDVLVGGTPCQAFSVAGLRNSLDDERGNLTLTYAHILDRIDTVRRERGLPPCICLWENVPGVLSTKDNAFGCFLGALAGEDEALVPSGKKWTNAGYVRGPERTIAWRTLDAQYFGVAQRRRRVFVVASAREGFCPAEVLFESDGVRRDTPPSREAGEGVAGDAGTGVAFGNRGHFGGMSEVEASDPLRSKGGDTGNGGESLVVPCFWNGEQVTQTLDAVLAKGQTMPEKNRFPAVLVPAIGFNGDQSAQTPSMGEREEQCPTLRADGPAHVAYGIPGNWIGREPKNGGNATEFPHEISPCLTGADKHGVVAFQAQDYKEGTYTEVTEAGPLTTSQDRSRSAPVIAFGVDIQNTRDEVREMAVVGALAAEPGMKQTSYIRQAMAVRRLTPVECARLQGFPDHHARIPWRGKSAEDCPDGPQYKTYGNSMAVPVIYWLGKRIARHLHP